MGKGSVSAPNIDTSEAIEAFQLGADVIEQQYPRAFAQYEQALGKGTRQALDQFTQSQIQAFPFTDTARESVNELRKFTGMKPISKTATLATKLENMRAKFDTPGMKNSTVGTVVADLADQAGRLEQLDDPGKRQEGYNSLVQSLNEIQYGMQQDVNEYYNATTRGDLASQGQNVDARTVDKDAKYYGATGLGQQSFLNERERGNVREDTDYRTAYGKRITEFTGTTPQQYDDLRRVGDNLADLTNDTRQDLSGVEADYRQNFEQEAPRAYTGEEITQQLENLPEYQFQLKQGQKALERSQAAKGTLASGGALLEAQQFGQGLAQNVYAGHVNRLAGLAGLNMPVAQQQIGQTTATGGFLANQFGQVGQQSLATTQGIANARQSAFNQQGQTLYDAQKTQAKMQMEAQMFNAKQQSGLGGIASKLLGGLF